MSFVQVVKYKRKGNINIPVDKESAVTEPVEKNKSKKTPQKMDEKVNKAEEIMNNMKKANHVKVVKKDKGLIERTESSKIVLTEDNRQVLND